MFYLKGNFSFFFYVSFSLRSKKKFAQAKLTVNAVWSSIPAHSKRLPELRQIINDISVSLK